jgi:hypothetical protein
MWLFTTDGFYSVVEDRNDPSMLVVRARVELDALTLQSRLQDQRVYVRVKHTPAADYAYRLFVPRQAWSVYLQNAVEAIDYPNFKDAVRREQGAARAHTYLDVWGTMWTLQETERGKTT